MIVENPKLVTYLNLIDAAESYTFWVTTDGIISTGLAHVVMTALAAQMQGLTSAEINNAIKIGEFRGSLQVLKTPVSAPDPTLTLEYWQQVKQEAEQFWLNRYRGEE